MKRLIKAFDFVRALPRLAVAVLDAFLEYEEQQFSPNCPVCGQEGSVAEGAELVSPGYISRVCPNGHMYRQRVSVGIGTSVV